MDKKQLQSEAKLAKAERNSFEGRMVAAVSKNGELEIRGASEKESKQLDAVLHQIGAKRPELSTVEIEERTQALIGVIAEKMAWEREQIVAVVRGYSEDCARRSDELVGDRAKAFKIRAAVAEDLAAKIESGWGRHPNGSVIEWAAEMTLSTRR